MRNVLRRLIYRKWFYAFLALAMWFDAWTDVMELQADGPRGREVLSLVLSIIGAVLVSLVFIDLHHRRPPEGG